MQYIIDDKNYKLNLNKIINILNYKFHKYFN
jgi:hypothetical protein